MLDTANQYPMLNSSHLDLEFDTNLNQSLDFSFDQKVPPYGLLPPLFNNHSDFNVLSQEIPDTTSGYHDQITVDTQTMFDQYVAQQQQNTFDNMYTSIQTQTQFKNDTQSDTPSPPPFYNSPLAVYSGTSLSPCNNPSKLQSSVASPSSSETPKITDAPSSFAKIPRSSPYSSPKSTATSSTTSSSKEQEIHSPLASPIHLIQAPCVSTPWPSWDEIRVMEVKNPAMPGVSVTLQNAKVWKKLKELGNEMTVTKEGRPLTPGISIQITGLEDESVYAVWLVFMPIDLKPRSFNTESMAWEIKGSPRSTKSVKKSEREVENSIYVTGLSKKGLVLNRCKINFPVKIAPDDDDTNFHVKLRRNLPYKICVCITNQEFDPSNMHIPKPEESFPLDICKFIPVSKYHNKAVNEFKKEMRESKKNSSYQDEEDFDF